MTNEKLLKTRFYPAIQKMYREAETVFPKEELPEWFDYSFKTISKYAPYTDGEKNRRQFPLDAFYLSNEEYKKIVDESVKGLRSQYVFPYRSEIVFDDEEIEKMKKRLEKLIAEGSVDSWTISEIQDKIKWNDEYRRRNKLWKEYYAKWQKNEKELKDKKIDRKEFNRKMKKLYKEYGCEKRCHDGERIRFSLFDYGPNSNKEFFESVKRIYNGEKDENENNPKYTEAVKIAKDFINNLKNNTPTQND